MDGGGVDGSVDGGGVDSGMVGVGLHRLPFITRCDRGCLMFTSIY